MPVSSRFWKQMEWFSRWVICRETSSQPTIFLNYAREFSLRKSEWPSVGWSRTHLTSIDIKWVKKKRIFRKWNKCSKSTLSGAKNWSKLRTRWSRRLSIGRGRPPPPTTKTSKSKKNSSKSPKNKWKKLPNSPARTRRSHPSRSWWKIMAYKLWKRHFARSAKTQWKKASWSKKTASTKLTSSESWSWQQTWPASTSKSNSTVNGFSF